MTKFHVNVSAVQLLVFVCVPILTISFATRRSSGSYAQSAEASFLIFKYQHPVGKEIDSCVEQQAGRSCHSHFQLDFTGSSIALDADIQTDRAKRSISFVAKGQNSTRSYIDVNVRIAGTQSTIIENGVTRQTTVPQRFFALQQDVPVIAQELLFSYWFAQGRPPTIQLLPA